MQKNIAIIGSGDLGIQLYNHLKYLNYNIIGFLNDFYPSGINNGLNILGKIKDAKTIAVKNKIDYYVNAIGYNDLNARHKVFEILKGKNLHFLTFIHHTCIIDKSATIEEGALLYPGVIVDMNCVIGANTLLNNGCIVSHDTTVGKSNFFAPGSIISGFCTIENCIFLGSGTIINDNINVCNHVKTGSGTVIINHITKPGTYIGQPAKKI